MSNTRDSSFQQPALPVADDVANVTTSISTKTMQEVMARSRAMRAALLAKNLKPYTEKFEETKKMIAQKAEIDKQKEARLQEATEVGLPEKLPAILSAKRRRVAQLNAQADDFKVELETVAIPEPTDSVASTSEPINDENPEEVLTELKRKMTHLKRETRNNKTVQECSSRHMNFFEKKLGASDALDQRLKGENEEAARLFNSAATLLDQNDPFKLSN